MNSAPDHRLMKPRTIDAVIATKRVLNVIDQNPRLRIPIRENPKMARYAIKAKEPSPSPCTTTDWVSLAPTGPPAFSMWAFSATICPTDIELTMLWSSAPDRINDIAATDIYTARKTNATPTTA